MAGMGEDAPESLMSSVMKEFSKLKMKDEDSQFSPFDGLEQAAVLQNARQFSNAEFVMKEPRMCCQVITELLYLLYHGEYFSPSETTEVFFGVTKLFQSTDPNLRRMMYLFIKELSESTASEEVIIVISCLVKDMTSDNSLRRGNAIRVLSKIIDSGFLGQIERYFQQAIVDKESMVASAALVSGIFLLEKGPSYMDIVRRWSNQVQEALNLTNDMVQYHALCLLYEVRKHDKHALSKVVLQLCTSVLKSPLAMYQLVCYAAQLMKRDLAESNLRMLLDFLDSCLRHKSEMVIYEAARAICSLPTASPSDLSPATTVLQMFLSSPKPTLRFAAVRTLNRVSMQHPTVVSKCNDDMEALITDSNRSIATLAITTLLKTGSENSVDRLMKQISSFISEIGDEFKIVVVLAIQSLCLKFPKKHGVLMSFLSNILREEGGYEFKKAIVDAMIAVMTGLPETKDMALFHLCEFIEDCEFVQLSTRILNLLGEEAPATRQPAKYIRFIFNRVILENARVRAAAVSALAKLGAKVEQLRPSIVVLLRRCLNDNDNEVRDRATVALQLLEHHSHLAQKFMLEALPMSTDALGRSLALYKKRMSDGPLTLGALPHVEEKVVPPAEKKAKMDGEGKMANGSEPAESAHGATLYDIPQFANLGPLFRSSKESALSQAESEFVVKCIKHVFQQHVVFQFIVTNTVDDSVLDDVRVVMTPEDDELFNEDNFVAVPAKRCLFGEPTSCYVLTERQDGAFGSCVFGTELKFVCKDIDPQTGEMDEDDEGEEDEFPLEDLEVSTGDFIAQCIVGSFRQEWGAMNTENSVLEKFVLNFKTVKETAERIIALFGMASCEGTGKVADETRSHMLLLAGTFLDGSKVLVRAHVALSTGGCQLKMEVRSEDLAISKLVIECVQ